MQVRTHSLLALFLFTSIIVAGCSDNPVEPEEHEEAVGFALLNDQFEIYRQTAIPSSDTLAVTSGATTPLYTVRFVDEDGDLFTPDEEGTSLGILIGDTSVVRVASLLENEWKFSLEGAAAGETTLEVLLNHGGHSDYRSAPLTIVVK